MRRIAALALLFIVVATLAVAGAQGPIPPPPPHYGHGIIWVTVTQDHPTFGQMIESGPTEGFNLIRSPLYPRGYGILTVNFYSSTVTVTPPNGGQPFETSYGQHQAGFHVGVLTPTTVATSIQ